MDRIRISRWRFCASKLSLRKRALLYPSSRVRLQGARVGRWIGVCLFILQGIGMVAIPRYRQISVNRPKAIV